MPVEYFLRYRGKCYDVGTMLRFRQNLCIYVGTIQRFTHNGMWLLTNTGQECYVSRVHSLDNIILAIVIPVYYEEPDKVITTYRDTPSDDNLFIGWIWYIVIMLGALIFKDCLMIWAFATIVFYLWKKGFLNGGKK